MANRARTFSLHRLSLATTVLLGLGLSTVPAQAAQAPAGTPTPATTSYAAPVQTGSTDFGVYTAPGAKGVAGAAQWASFTKRPVTRVVDYLADGSWYELAQNTSWLMGAYTGTGLQLDLGVPLLPKNEGTLQQCAAGEYDHYWAQIGRDLVKHQLPNTTLRPGWEMNGDWYRWSAAADPASYVGCYRHFVDATRAVPGANFNYTWTVNVNRGTLAAEDVYPGDDYVDQIGVNVYDTSWTWYPAPASTSTETARQRAWQYLARGDHGLDFWAGYAREHGKPLALPEWGATERSDGHGGGDNPYFIDKMFDFIDDPANRVAYACYFNYDAPSLQHALLGETRFPQAAERLTARLATTSVVGAAPAGTGGTTTEGTTPESTTGGGTTTQTPPTSGGVTPTPPVGRSLKRGNARFHDQARAFGKTQRS